MTIRVLVITRSEWTDENSLGNTLSNLFTDATELEIANLYFRTAPPRNDACRHYYSLTELNQVFGGGHEFLSPARGCPRALAATIAGRDENLPTADHLAVTGRLERAILSSLRRRDWALPLLLQDAFWRLGLWKAPSFMSFLDGFKPDVIFFPSFHTPYIHRVVSYIARRSGAKIVAFHTDDYIFTKAPSFALFRRIYYRMRRRQVLRTAADAALNYCITNLQAEAYRQLVDMPFKVLYKGADLATGAKANQRPSAMAHPRQIRMVYAGSLLHGRWKTLKLLIDRLGHVSVNHLDVRVDIYSQYSPPPSVLESIVKPGISVFHGAVPNAQIKKLYDEADFALHLESFDEDDIATTKFSFSTKIVDCLASEACLLAIGPSNIASIDYLKSKGMAIVIDQIEEVDGILLGVFNNAFPITQYREAAKRFIAEHHDLTAIREGLLGDLRACSQRGLGASRASA